MCGEIGQGGMRMLRPLGRMEKAEIVLDTYLIADCITTETRC
jgi:hypothetical protein